MKGFEVGERYDTMGLRGNDLRRLYFNDVRVPAENVLGEPGEGFHIAMTVLNNGRIGLGTGLGRRRQEAARPGDRPRQGAAPVRPAARRLRARPGEDRLDGLLPVRARVDGLPDLRARRRRVEDYSLESAICKVAGTEFLWYAANRAMQLAGGAGYMKDRALREDPARHPDLPDLRGRQRRPARVRRADGHEAGGREALRARRDRPRRPDRLDRRPRRLRRRPDPARGAARARSRMAHPELQGPCRRRSSDQVKELPAISEALLRKHRKGIVEASSSRSGSPTRSPTSTRRSRCSRG